MDGIEALQPIDSARPAGTEMTERNKGCDNTKPQEEQHGVHESAKTQRSRGQGSDDPD